MRLAGKTDSGVAEFQRSLLAWFETSARDLPWRQSRDPYAVWVSEIMLQQTRVAAVLEHYARFMERFPTVVSLALAEEYQVLAAWSGLGYYRRAKMLHKAAQCVVREYRGTLPRTAEHLRTLPGIGEYTAAAIASIAFGEPVAVVDGNVERVILRLFPAEQERAVRRAGDAGSDLGMRAAGPAERARWVRRQAAALLRPERAGEFNQSMMELGATVCLPKNPLCLACPVERFCRTRGEHAVEPGKRMRSREIAYALLERKGGHGGSGVHQVLLVQRPPTASQMPGMWELPEIPIDEGDEERVELTLRHSITVTNYYVRILRLSLSEGRRRLGDARSEGKWMEISVLGELPLTGLARKVLRRLKIMPMGSGPAESQGRRSSR